MNTISIRLNSIRILALLMTLVFALNALAYDEATREAQAALLQQGYQPGVVDGMIGSQTKHAIQAFQGTHSLPQTGELDDRTLEALGILATRKVVQQVQAALIQKGYRLGSADGMMGRQTVEAIRAFQRDHNLAQSGSLDAKILNVLGITTAFAAEIDSKTLNGEVTKVSIQSDDPMVANASVGADGHASMVVINLLGQAENEYRIGLSEIIKLKTFRDLNGRHQMMGGLLILIPLQERLIGKTVEIESQKISGHQYLVRNLTIVP